MPKREFLMLSHKRKPKHAIGGWFMSEKLDGMRCFWDGGISRGIPKAAIPWANTAKDHRYVVEQVATGLWSRYGNVIHGPSWFLDRLPKGVLLDGELWAGRGRRQFLMSTVKQLEPDSRWEEVRYMPFNLVPPKRVFMSGTINIVNFKKDFGRSMEWAMARLPDDVKGSIRYESAYYVLQRLGIPFVEQRQLPFQTVAADEIVDNELRRITEAGGEGLILISPDCYWQPWRSHDTLKVKKYDDDEGIVVGYFAGHGKLLGMMGSMILEYNGSRFELSGFTDAERRVGSPEAEEWCKANPGAEFPAWASVSMFPRGTSVTFTYRGLTDDGIPNEASYLRKREAE